MAKSIYDILGYMPLTEALRTTSMGVPNPFKFGGMDLFSVSEGDRVIGDKFRFVTLKGERRTVKRAEYGAPSRGRALKDPGYVDGRLVHFFEHIDLDPLVYQQLHSPEAYVQDQGIEILSDEIESAGIRLANDRIVMVASTLRHAALYFDADGDILPSSSGAEYTFSFNRSANNANQLNGIISASWALTNTDIPTQLINLKSTAAETHGYEPEVCFYGKNVPKYLMQNDHIGAFLQRNPGYNDEYLRTNKIPDGLFGFKWVPVYTAFYEDSAGTNQQLWDDDLCVFTPGVADLGERMRWWAFKEGSFMVPTSMDVRANINNPFANFKTEYGQFAYCVPKVNPVAATVHYGDTCSPVLRKADATYAATVAF